MSDTEDGPARALWYLRRDGLVTGPFPAAQIARYAILGRVRLTDEVSPDRERWSPLEGHPRLVPAPLREGANEGTLRRLRLREDERSGLDRRAEQAPSPEVLERRSGHERRRPEPPELAQGRVRRQALLQGMRRGASRPTGVWIGLGVVSLLVVGAALLVAPGSAPQSARCNAAPAPGVDWHGCRLDGLDLTGVDLSHAQLRDTGGNGVRLVRARLKRADLAYAELPEAQLGEVDLAGARLIGANLRGADLTGANLSGADLSYADLYQAGISGVRLEGARLDRAVWVDGHVCPPGSVGDCPTP